VRLGGAEQTGLRARQKVLDARGLGIELHSKITINSAESRLASCVLCKRWCVARALSATQMREVFMQMGAANLNTTTAALSYYLRAAQ
jgi:hypothetical protein